MKVDRGSNAVVNPGLIVLLMNSLSTKRLSKARKRSISRSEAKRADVDLEIWGLEVLFRATNDLLIKG
jgi:hypothetical protein